MSDTDTLPAIAPAPAGASAETLASAAAQYKAAGYDDAAILSAGYGPAAPQINSNITTVRAPGANTFMSGNGVTHEQAVSAAKNLIAHGVDAAVVLEAAKAHGVTEAELAYTPPSKEAVAAQQRDADTEAGFAPPAKGEGYQLNYGREFAEASDPADLASLHQEIQSAFKSAEVPAALAQPLLSAILETGERYADEAMTDAGRELMWKEEGALFNKTSRDPAEDLRLANLGYSLLPKAFREQLDANYALHSAAAQFQLAALGRAHEYRAKR